MLVFRPSVLPRTCETPCGEGPDRVRALAGPSGALLYYFSPFLAHEPLFSSPTTPATTEDGIFYFVVFRRRAGLALSFPLYPDTSLVTFHIQSSLAYLKARQRVVEEGKVKGGGNNANMETYVWESLARANSQSRRYENNFFFYSCI